MKRIWLLVPALALTLVGGTLIASAAGGPTKPYVASKSQKSGTMTPKAKEKMEGIAGKALTTKQERDLLDEEVAYRTALAELMMKHEATVATTLGMTVEQYFAADEAAKAKAKEDKKNIKAPEPAAAPAG